MRSSSTAAFAAATLALTASACSTANQALPQLPNQTSLVSSGAARVTGVPAGYGILRFRIAVPGRAHSSALHRAMPAYVSSATRKAAVTVRGANQSPATTEKFGCTAVCSGKISAPLGVDAVTIALEDKKGRVLSRGSTTVLVFKKSGNVIDFTLDGVPASVALVPEANVLPVVPGSTGVVNFDARDADGRIITPDGHYTDANGNPLVFTLTSSNSALRLSVNTVSAPGTPIQFAYNGKLHVGSIALTPAASKGIHTTVKFHPATLALVPGVATRISPPIPVQVLSATQVPLGATAGFNPNAIFILGNSGGESASLAFNVMSRVYGSTNAEAAGAPFQSPPIDLGNGNGFWGYLEYGNNSFAYERVTPNSETVSSSGQPNPCTSFSTPIGTDGAGTLFCQQVGFPGAIYDFTHANFVATGQDRKIETIDGIDYFVTVNDAAGASPGLSVYAAGSSTAVTGATSVGANVTNSTVAYYGNADGTVSQVGGSTVASFSHSVLSVVGYGSSVHVYEQGGVFGTFNGSRTFESRGLRIGNVVEVVTGVNGTPMLVESDGTLDVMGI